LPPGPAIVHVVHVPYGNRSNNAARCGSEVPPLNGATSASLAHRAAPEVVYARSPKHDLARSGARSTTRSQSFRNCAGDPAAEGPSRSASSSCPDYRPLTSCGARAGPTASSNDVAVVLPVSRVLREVGLDAHVSWAAPLSTGTRRLPDYAARPRVARSSGASPLPLLASSRTGSPCNAAWRPVARDRNRTAGRNNRRGSRDRCSPPDRYVTYANSPGLVHLKATSRTAALPAAHCKRDGSSRGRAWSGSTRSRPSLPSRTDRAREPPRSTVVRHRLVRRRGCLFRDSRVRGACLPGVLKNALRMASSARVIFSTGTRRV